jgi:hypothetical protein
LPSRNIGRPRKDTGKHLRFGCHCHAP